MLCELITLGCLVAHGDIKATDTKDFRQAYDPNIILKRLEELHPAFYPVPVIPEITYGTPGSVHLGDFDKPYLTKDDLLSLWNRSGDILHRGNLRRLMKGPIPPVTNWDDVNEWGKKIMNLLSAHRIVRVGNKFVFPGFLTVLSSGGKAQISIAEAPDDASVE